MRAQSVLALRMLLSNVMLGYSKHPPRTEAAADILLILIGFSWRRKCQNLQKPLWTAAILALFPWAVQGTINPPTNFRTDPADFSDLALPVGAIAYQFRWTDNAANELGYQIEVSRDG